MAPKTKGAKVHWDIANNFIILWCMVVCAAAKCPPEWCGSMNVSYPFWIQNPSCGYPGFQINCKANVPFLPTRDRDFEILKMKSTGYIIINSTSLKAMCNRTEFVVFRLPKEGPFTISSSNRFAVVGCRTGGSFNNRIWQGICIAECQKYSGRAYCNNNGCCTLRIPAFLKYLNFTVGETWNTGLCGFSTILDPNTFTVPDNEKGDLGRGRYGLRLDWGVGHENCLAARGTSNYSCAEHAICSDSRTGEGHVCKCPDGYEGNGYSNSTGCTDIDECSLKNLNKCVEKRRGGICLNSPGLYKCFCQKGYIGNGYRNGYKNRYLNGKGCESTSSNNVVVPAIIGSVSSFVGVSLVASALFWCLRRRHMNHVRAKYFQQNGGIQLEQYISSRGGRATLKIYSATELEKASKNYSSDMKLGSGGYGTVFKAILPDDIVGAIKKSKEISEPQQEGDQFINELIILSQINHRNVVKLLGCCLETHYPLLVYEFVPNGTLHEHIHSDSEEYLPWEIRLRIAIETAEALAYLHSAASQPIFHRDVKSSNILLDNTYTPKVADFGISRLLNADQTHLTTNVAGTRGYMDPEYFQSFQLTDKSDVYSFGVVLLELLTGLEPLSLERPIDEIPLSGLFLCKMNSNRLHEILDLNIINAETSMQMKNMAGLARECLHVEGRRRPSMKEVVEELIWIRGATRRRQPYPSDERYEGNGGDEMHMQIGTSDRAEIEKEKLVLGSGGLGESTSEGSSVALIQSFSIDGR